MVEMSDRIAAIVKKEKNLNANVDFIPPRFITALASPPTSSRRFRHRPHLGLDGPYHRAA